MALLLRFIPFLFLSAVVSLEARAQTAPKVHRIGIVMPTTEEVLARKASPVQVPFEEGMKEHGWIEGRNVQFLYRPTAGMGELVKLPVDVLVTFGGEYREAMQATSTIPIVAHMTGAAQEGLVKSLARPGGNLTGISVEVHDDLVGKRLALLKEAAPVTRVARFIPAEGLRFGTDKDMLPTYASSARALGIEIFPVFARSPDDVRQAFAELSRRGVNGLSIVPFSRIAGSEATWDALLEMIARYRLPAMFDVPRAVTSGGLMAYGDDFPDRARRLSHYVDRILRGAKPGDLPIEQPSNRFVVNPKAAASIGLKLPQSILLQADQVIQ